MANLNPNISISINTDGVMTFIYTDELSELAEQGTTCRASHVEPIGNGHWTADLSPIGGPTLGPFKKRRDALDAEVVWLKENIIYA